MKKILLALFVLTFLKSLYCIDTLRVKSKITDVTVFFNGAQVTRTVDIKLKKGKHILLFDDLTQEINPASIQISAIEKSKILSVKHQLKTPNTNQKDNKVVEIENDIRSLEFKINDKKNKIRVFDIEEKLLLDNSILYRPDTGSSIKIIKEAAEFYRIRLNEIMQSKLNINLELDALNEQIKELYKQLNEVVSKNRMTYSQIYVAIDCETDISTKLKASYYISSASWKPSYDFRVEDISKPLVIVYNADVSQTSGESWENVNITLSTNNPSLSGNKPDLIPLQVGNNPYQNNTITTQYASLRGKVLETDKQTPIQFANVMLYQGDKPIAYATTDVEGNYYIKSVPYGSYILKSVYIGYNNFENKNVYLQANIDNYFNINMNVSKLKYDEVQKQTESIISQPTIPLTNGLFMQDGEFRSVRGNRTDGTIVYIDGVQVQGNSNTAKEATTTNYISNTLKSGVTNIEYAIEIPYTIPSDGRENMIKIKESSLPVNYIYHTVPKIEKEVFLSAEIIDWNVLNLLSGKINIYYQDTYTGESYIDVNNASDTLNVSLGRDKGILVQREGNKELFDKKIIGSNVKETIAWNITVKNNKDAKIKIIIEDQFPLSYRKSVEVMLINALNAKIDDKTGKLVWELELNPNEKKVLNFVYSVKYPKYTNLLVE